MEPLTDQDLNDMIDARVLLDADSQPFNSDPDLVRLVAEVRRLRQENAALIGAPSSGVHLPFNVQPEHCKEGPLFRALRSAINANAASWIAPRRHEAIRSRLLLSTAALLKMSSMLRSMAFKRAASDGAENVWRVRSSYCARKLLATFFRSFRGTNPPEASQRMPPKSTVRTYPTTRPKRIPSVLHNRSRPTTPPPRITR